MSEYNDIIIKTFIDEKQQSLSTIIYEREDVLNAINEYGDWY